MGLAATVATGGAVQKQLATVDPTRKQRRRQMARAKTEKQQKTTTAVRRIRPRGKEESGDNL